MKLVIESLKPSTSKVNSFLNSRLDSSKAISAKYLNSLVYSLNKLVHRLAYTYANAEYPMPQLFLKIYLFY